MVKQDARLTVKEIADSAGVSLGTVHKILTQELKLRKVFCTMGPASLDQRTKDHPCKNGENCFEKVQKF